MRAHLRSARPVSDLLRSEAMYSEGLSLVRLGSFAEHAGFDGVMLGSPDGEYHFEFTFCRSHAVQPSPTPEDLLVFYVTDSQAWQARCETLRKAGFVEVAPFNPYWSIFGCTFEDFDGYRAVIQRSQWPVEACATAETHGVE